MNDIDFIYHLDEASKHIDWLNKFFEENINPITKKEISHLKSSKNKDVQIPYADFKVDEPPLFNNELVEQLSFEDIIKEKNIAPVRRRNPESFTFDGVCPHSLHRTLTILIVTVELDILKVLGYFACLIRHPECLQFGHFKVIRSV